MFSFTYCTRFTSTYCGGKHGAFEDSDFCVLTLSLHCPFQILAILLSFAVAMASLRLISGVGFFPFASILVPIYSNLSILSISSPSNSMTVSFSHLSVFCVLLLIFDYCNSLLSGIAETDLTKLQRVLNRLARVVTKSPPFTHSVPLLRSLH